MPPANWLHYPPVFAPAFGACNLALYQHQIQLEAELAPGSEIAMQEQLYNQTAREMGYCGRFKAWQMAAMFMGGVLVLFTALPAITYLFGMTWK